MKSLWVEPTLEQFPEVMPHGRILYFAVIPDFADVLAMRGYQVVALATLPRSGTLDEQTYLRAKLQGIEEGTVRASDAQLTALKTQVDLMFGKKAFDGVLASTNGRGLLEALDWNASRHTVVGNTTMAEARSNPLGIGETEKLS